MFEQTTVFFYEVKSAWSMENLIKENIPLERNTSLFPLSWGKTNMFLG